jgi:S1-C subfamily serine protease
MDMEKLTKQQIVLVTLLVSFVTSIATGIVTVALMDQAPAGVTQTINRIVERTIEKAVTIPATTNSAAVVTRETVVVKEDDQIIGSIDKNKTSIVRIYTNMSNAGDVAQRTFIGLGTIISKEGLIITGDVFADTNGRYMVTVDNNKFYSVVVLPKKTDGQLYFLKIVQDAKNIVDFIPVTFSDSNNLKLGQTVIVWGGEEQDSVSTGIVSSLINIVGSVSTTTSTSTGPITSKISAINTSIALTDSLSGGPLLNLSGEVVGLKVSSTISDKINFIPSNVLKQEVANYASVQ